MKIYNLTAHPLCIIDEHDIAYNNIMRKWVATSNNPRVVSVVPQYSTCSVKNNVEQVGSVNGIPIYEKTVKYIEPLPKTDDIKNTIYIVSSAYAEIYKKLYPSSKANIYTVSDRVYALDGRTTIGSRGINKY